MQHHATILRVQKNVQLQNPFARSAIGNLRVRSQIHPHLHLTNASGYHARKFASRQNRTPVSLATLSLPANPSKNPANGLHVLNTVLPRNLKLRKSGMAKFKRHVIRMAIVLPHLHQLLHQLLYPNLATHMANVRSLLPKSLKFGMVKFKLQCTCLKSLLRQKLPKFGTDKSKHRLSMGTINLLSETSQKTTKGRG